MLLAKKISLLLKSLKSQKKRRRLKKFGSFASGVLVNSNSYYYLCDPSDGHVSRQLLKTGQYNSKEIENIQSLINSKSKVLIIGAHIGSLLIPISKKTFSIDAVEANPNNFSFLELNIKLNSCQNVKTYNFAATSQTKKIDFILSKENSGGSKVYPKKNEIGYFYDNPEIIKIQGKKLDDCFSEKYDLILMDIEGSEYDAMLGAKGLINSTKKLVIEFIPHHIKSVAGINIKKFAELLLTFSFKKVTFPSYGFSGKPEEILIQTLNEIDEKGLYEDGIIFER